jgi:hypothetical protein
MMKKATKQMSAMEEKKSHVPSLQCAHEEVANEEHH